MIRLNLVVEGQTEEMFVNKVLRTHLAAHGVQARPRLIFTGRKYGRTFRGGVTRYGNFKWDLMLWMREDSDHRSHFTTMLDLYGLPGDFPGQLKARKAHDPYRKVEILEEAMARDIDDPRFIPYIQLHEFETLLLADPEQFGRFFLENRQPVRELAAMVREYDSPEYINGGETTAPSKRIAQYLPAYSRLKSVAGPFIAGSIGLEAMRRKCPHFNAWLERLEGIAAEVED